MSESPQISNPQAVAEAGEKIYREKYRPQYEKDHPGWFLAIEVHSGKAFLAEEPEDALNQARKDSPKGVFHLIRIGASGTFRVSYSSNANRDWVFR